MASVPSTVLAFTALLACMTPSVALGEVYRYAEVPGQADLMPHYFSGTSAVAKGTASASGTDAQGAPVYLASARLYLNGIQVKSWTNVEPPQHLTPQLAVVFDSSHFPNSTPLEVKIEGTDTTGVTFSATKNRPVDNRIVGFQWPGFNGWWSNGLAALQSQTAGLNYQFVGTDSWGWGPPSIFADLKSAGVFYVNSHGYCGSPTCHDTAYEDSENGVWVTMFGPITMGLELLRSYRHQRQERNGTGLPPFNQSAWISYPYSPPVHFAHFDSCESGGEWHGAADNSFAEILFPFQDANFPGLWTPNQAALTWKCFLQSSSTETVVNQMYSRMKSRWTAGRARDQMVLDSALGVAAVKVSETGAMLTWVDLVSADQCPLWGDHTTRIKGVWTGNHFLPGSNWYR
jgi:hypothetical protein